MTNHMTAANVAARTKMQEYLGCKKLRFYEYCKAHGRWNKAGNYCADIDDLADLAIEAALPHIREQLAQEIEAGMMGELRKMHNLEWRDGMETAAKIVEGQTNE